MSGNNFKFLRIKVDKKTFDAVIKIINKQNKTVQGAMEELLKDFIFENIDLIVGGDEN